MFNWLKRSSTTSTKFAEPAPINIEKISDEATLLAHIADSSLSNSTRSTAISKVTNPQALLSLAEQHSGLLSAISNRLDTLEPQWIERHTLSENTVQQLLSKHDVNIKNKEFLVEKISERCEANALLKKVTDKHSQRLLRNKIKELAQVAKDNAATVEASEQLVEKLSHLAGLPWNSQFSGKIIKLKEHWSALDESKIPAALSQQYTTLLQTSEATLAIHQDEQAQIDAQHAHQEKLVQCIETLEEHIAQLSKETPENCTASEQLLESSTQQWDTLNQTAPASAPLKNSWTILSEKLTAYIDADKNTQDLDLTGFSSESALQEDQVETVNIKQSNALESIISNLKPRLKTTPWPQWLAPTEKYNQAQSLLTQAQAEFKKHAKIHDKTLQHIRQKNRELSSKLTEKNLIAASRLNFYIHNKLDTLPQKWKDEAVDFMGRNLEELKKLEELNDFATEPKKLELCEKMEKLCVENTAQPEELANIIQSIQAEWKESNPLARDDDPLWQRFSEAANKAWEPCAAFYAENQKVREANVEKRRNICDQLSLLLNKEDWNKTDWKAILEVEKTARQEWRQADPVDFKLNRPIQKTFFSLLDKLKEKVTEQQKVLLAEKDELIQKVEALEEVELDKAIETCKFLQQKWKTIDTLKIGEDRAHWKKFRAACDRVFKRLDEKRSAEKESRNELLNQADEIISKIRKLGSLNDSEILQSRDQLDSLKAEYQTLEDMPEYIAERKEQDLQKAISHYENQIDAMVQRKATATQSKVFDLSLLLNNFEQSPTDKLKEDIDAIIEELNNSNLKTALKKVFKRYETPKQTQDALTKLERLALEYEILADVETPEAYKAQRMEYQLQQLTGNAESIVQSNDLSPLLNLDVRWAEISNSDEIEPSIRETLEARRAQARTKLS